jgi:hypothetical protein
VARREHPEIPLLAKRPCFGKTSITFFVGARFFLDLENEEATGG